MATRGKPLSAVLSRKAVRLARTRGIRAAARALGIDRNTVRKYLRTALQMSHGGQPAPAGR
jgi:hypothetical protein